MFAYIGLVPISEITPDRRWQIETTKNRMKDGWEGKLYSREVENPLLPDYSIFQMGSAYLIVERKTNNLAGIYNGPFVHYVDEGMQGRGICSAMHVWADLRGERKHAEAYSASGMHARVRAHQLHLQRAIVSGENIPIPASAGYILECGTYRLIEPYTVQTHKANLRLFRTSNRFALSGDGLILS